jgi:hypothetical protein
MGTALAAAKHKPQVAYFHFCGEALWTCLNTPLPYTRAGCWPGSAG